MEKPEIKISGQKLVADYQSVMIDLATSEAASYEAERSESEMLSKLSTSSAGGYLNPSNINQSIGENIARVSLDTHVKKVQAEQIKSISTAQVQEILAEDKKVYLGKKVHITSLDRSYSPFESLWFDPQNGYRTYDFKKPSISGKIEEILIEKNALVLKPNFMRRIFVSDLKFFVAYIINPTTLEPTVSIEII